MGTVLNSTDNLIASAITNGMLSRCINLRQAAAASTTQTTSCGSVIVTRFSTTFTVPSVGAGLTGMYITSSDQEIGSGGATVTALEYLLGTLTVSGNVFASGSTMPTKAISGTSVQTSSIIPILVVTTTLTATTPVVTITYTDQDGNSGNTATLTLPTNPLINTGFLITPHLASGDTGIRAVTNISISTGSAGVLKIYGLLQVSAGTHQTTGQSKSIPPLVSPAPMYLCEAGESIGFYRFGVAAAADAVITLCGVAEN